MVGAFVTSPIWGTALTLGGGIVMLVGAGIMIHDTLVDEDNCHNCDGSGYHEDGDRCLTCNP